MSRTCRVPEPVIYLSDEPYDKLTYRSIKSSDYNVAFFEGICQTLDSGTWILTGSETVE